jgi:hypothetical protein
VKTYRLEYPKNLPKADAPAGPVHGGGPSAPQTSGPVRLLGAIIPAGNGMSYFVKFVGPADKVDANEKDFDAFLNSVKVPGENGKPVGWTDPPGWKEAPARQMRLVTLQKADGSAPDLYISDPFSGSLLDNVNRWRTGDVGLPRVTEADLPTVTKEVQLGGVKAHRVDFSGPGGKGGMGPCFGGGAK